MQRDVELGPEHLVDRAGRAHVAAVGEPGDRAPGVEAVGLRLDPGVDDAVRERRVGLLAGTGRRAGRRPRRTGRGSAATGRARCRPCDIATRQPSPGAPSTSASGTNTSSKKTSAKPGLAVELGDRAHRDAVGVEREEEVGEPVVALRLRVGAEQPEAPVRERRPRRPGLLAVEHPAAALVVAAARSSAARPGRSRPPARTSTAPRSARRSPSSAGTGPAAPGCRGRR